MRTFTDDERDRIRAQLRTAGREQFSRYGLRKTTIADLTEPADIATSTFYQFFDSKEALYRDILEAEGEALVERVIGSSFERYDDPERAIEAFLDAIMTEIETNPLIQRLVTEDEIQRLRASQPEADLAADRDESIGYFLPYVERWYDAGDLVGPDPLVIAHTIRAVTFVTLHEDDIGEEYYSATRDTLVRAVAAGLTRTDETTPDDR